MSASHSSFRPCATLRNVVQWLLCAAQRGNWEQGANGSAPPQTDAAAAKQLAAATRQLEALQQDHQQLQSAAAQQEQVRRKIGA